MTRPYLAGKTTKTLFFLQNTNFFHFWPEFEKKKLFFFRKKLGQKMEKTLIFSFHKGIKKIYKKSILASDFKKNSKNSKKSENKLIFDVLIWGRNNLKTHFSCFLLNFHISPSPIFFRMNFRQNKRIIFFRFCTDSEKKISFFVNFHFFLFLIFLVERNCCIFRPNCL